MQAAEELAQQKKLTDVRLNVFAFNQGALAFYQQLGYRTLSLQLHKALAGSDRYDEGREITP